MQLDILQGPPGPKGENGLTLGIEKVELILAKLCGYMQSYYRLRKSYFT